MVDRCTVSRHEVRPVSVKPATPHVRADRRHVRAALDGGAEHEAWAVIRRATRRTVTRSACIGGGAGGERCSTYRSRTACPRRPDAVDRLVAIPFRQVAERGFEAHDDGTPLTVVDIEQRARGPARRRARGARRRAGRVRRPRRLRDRRRGVRQSSSRRSSATRSATARAPTSSSAGTTGRSSTTGAPTRRSPCCVGCSSASAAPTGPTASSPATATWSAPAPSGTCRCTAATSG